MKKERKSGKGEERERTFRPRLFVARRSEQMERGTELLCKNAFSPLSPSIIRILLYFLSSLIWSTRIKSLAFAYELGRAIELRINLVISTPVCVVLFFLNDAQSPRFPSAPWRPTVTWTHRQRSTGECQAIVPICSVTLPTSDPTNLSTFFYLLPLQLTSFVQASIFNFDFYMYPLFN